MQTLRDVLFVSQTRISIEKRSRQVNGEWLTTTYTNPTDVLELASIGCKLNVADIYCKVKFEGGAGE